MYRLAARSIIIAVVAIVIASSPGAAQDRPTLTPEDYGQFETLAFGTACHLNPNSALAGRGFAGSIGNSCLQISDY